MKETTKQTYLSDYTDFHLVRMKEIEPTKHALLHTDIVHFLMHVLVCCKLAPSFRTQTTELKAHATYFGWFET